LKGWLADVESDGMAGMAGLMFQVHTIARALCCMLIVILWLGLHSDMQAASETPPPDPAVNPPLSSPPVRPVSGFDRALSDVEVLLSLAVLVFGLVLAVCQFLLMLKLSLEYDAAIRMLTLTLVITGTLFVITAGFAREQIAPAIGLFGTIIGYLLGRQAGSQK
jgi:hypothetical protein